MEDELFKQVYCMIKQTAKNKTLKRATFSHTQILRTYFWAVIRRLRGCVTGRNLTFQANGAVKTKQEQNCRMLMNL